MSEFDKWFKAEMPNSHKKVNKERIETVIYSCAEASWDHQQAKIDNLQKENDKLNIWYKNVKLQLENKQIDCDRSDKELEELQARVDRVVHILTYTNHASTPLCNELRDILKGKEDEN